VEASQKLAEELRRLAYVAIGAGLTALVLLERSDSDETRM
jgi:hypothetical protein